MVFNAQSQTIDRDFAIRGSLFYLLFMSQFSPSEWSYWWFEGIILIPNASLFLTDVALWIISVNDIILVISWSDTKGREAVDVRGNKQDQLMLHRRPLPLGQESPGLIVMLRWDESDLLSILHPTMGRHMPPCPCPAPRKTGPEDIRVREGVYGDVPGSLSPVSLHARRNYASLVWLLVWGVACTNGDRR